MNMRPFTQDPSNTTAFAALSPTTDAGLSSKCRAVVIGGGTGAPMSIRALLSLGCETSAVVAMADDGGSTGILRREANVSPPGDVRKCIAAFAADPSDPLTRAFKYRFEFARNHTLGNLLLSALEDAAGSFPEAIAICERLLKARGHVYPSTLDSVRLVAETRAGQLLEGQACACRSSVALRRVRLEADGPVRAYEPALDALRAADLIVLGPGSLFTSIIPNILLPGVVDAIRDSQAVVVFVCAVVDVQGETRGLSSAEHLAALVDHGMEQLIDYVLVHDPADSSAVALRQMPFADSDKLDLPDDPELEAAKVKPVRTTQEDIEAIQAFGARAIVRAYADLHRPFWHDPRMLRDVLAEVIRQCHLPQM